MIDTVIFENQYGDVFMPYEQDGIYMKSHSISPPTPRIHRFSLDGMDGALDMTEWAGEVKFEPREVQIAFRDMSADTYTALVQFCLGRMVKIMFSDDLDHYLYGRCDAADVATERRVSDYDMKFTCEPYRLERFLTTVERTVDQSAEITLRARRMTATPTITVTAACTLEFDDETYELEAGTHEMSGIRITDRPKVLSVTGSTGITITWRDGIL